jgi:hypothetical protein
MQVFDLFSLYFCCDGYSESGMKEATLGPVPVAYGSDREVDIHIIPTGPDTIRMDPYPFDMSPLRVAIPGRVVKRLVGQSEAQCRAAFYTAPRDSFAWTITS